MSLNENFRHNFSFLFAVTVVLGVCLACNFKAGENSRSDTSHTERSQSKKASADAPQKLESYTIKGFKFSYYLIPAGLSREQLIVTAQKLHDDEPDAQLILVDDDSGLAEYVAYAKQFSKGETAAQFPREWAEKHIVANVQKYLSGKYKLCERHGSIEIAELE